MMTRRSGHSFRKLMKRGTSVRDSLWGKLTSQHRHAAGGYGYKTPGDDNPNASQGPDVRTSLSRPAWSCPASLRRSLILEKAEDELFGFEITCNDSSSEDVRLSVISVEPESVADRAGMKPGDVLVSVNDVSVSECSHQQISDTILNSCSSIRLETISAVVAKKIELKRKLWQLKCQLEEKKVELYSLSSRERQLTGEKLEKCDSVMSLISFPDDDCSSGQGSTGSRLSACGSASAMSLCSTFEDLSIGSLSVRNSGSTYSAGGAVDHRQSFPFSDTAASSSHSLNAPSPSPSPLGFPLADGDHGSSDPNIAISSSSTSSSPPQSLRRRSPKGRSRQTGTLNRLTSLFSGSRASVAEEGIQEDVS